MENREFKNLMVTVLSFGFKYGIPQDADLVFDVRFLPNPYYLENLRPLSGNDAPVRDYVMNFELAHTFSDKLEDMIRFLIPNYITEGKTQLVIAVGCTGGKHRSVTLANELYRRLGENEEYGIRVEHRDIEKDGKNVFLRKRKRGAASPGRPCQTLQDCGAGCHYCLSRRDCPSVNQKIILRLSAENESIIRKCFTLLEKTFKINGEVSIDKRIVKKNNRFTIDVEDPEETVKILQAVKLLTADRRPIHSDTLVSQMVIQKNCCRRAFLRGAFLCAGSISDPEKFYHLKSCVRLRRRPCSCRKSSSLLKLMPR